MHTLRFPIRHTITLLLSLTHSSPAVVMAAAGTAARDFGGVILKLSAVKCEAAVKVVSGEEERVQKQKET